MARRRRWWLWLALALILGGPRPGNWSQPWPQQVYFRSRYAADGLRLLKATPAGNWMLDCADPPKNTRLLGMLLYDWEGQVRWKIRMPDVSGNTVFNQDNIVFSPDGRCAALALPQKTQARLLAWRDGKLLTDTRIPIQSPYDLLLAVEDGGRLWFARNGHPTCTLYALDGNRVIATGTHTSPLPAPPGVYIGRAIAPNGSALMTYREDDEGSRVSGPDVEYAALQVSGKRIIITNRYVFKGIGGHLLDDGLMIADGTTYNAQGRMARKSRLSYGGLFGDSALMTDDLLGRWLVCNPGTGLRWQIPADLDMYDISPDGRAAACYQRSDQGTSLCIYQYPGHLSATLRLDDHQHTGPLHWVRKTLDEGPPRWVKTTLLNEHGETLSTRDLFLSPDGHRVVLETVDSKERHAYYLFGW